MMGRRLLTFLSAGLVAVAGLVVWSQLSRPASPGRRPAPPEARDGAAAVARPTGEQPAPHVRVAAELVARETEAEIFGRFDTWAARYVAEVDAGARRGMVREGVDAAASRRKVMHELIAADPGRALEHGIPWGVRRALPAEVEALLENRVDGIGSYRALVIEGVEPEPENFRSTIRETVIDGATYETYVYGRRLELGSRNSLAVHGVAVDGRLALMDSPVRVLDAGEPIPAGRRIEELCAVSGRSTAAGAPGAPTTPIVADTGDRIIHLCSAGHIAVLASRLQAGEEGQDGGNSADGATTGIAGSVTGTKRVLMIRVRFADQPSWFEPETVATAESMFATADAFYAENSFGALRIAGSVSPIYTLPQTAEWYSTHDSLGYGLNVLNAARAVAADPASAAGNDGLAAVNYLDYDLEIVRYSTGPGSFSGQAFVATRGCWLKSSNPGVLTHELGHNLGLWHANAWKPGDALVPLGQGANLEYGDVFDTMGPSRGGAWHFNAWEKARLGWLPAAGISSVDDGGVVALAAHDGGGPLETGRRYAVKVQRDGDRDYWLEFRRHAGWSDERPDVLAGIGVRWDPWAKSNGGSQLVDTTPGSAGGRDDATLVIGRTFSDAAAGVHITPIGHNPADPSAIDVEVRVGEFASNRRPTVTLSSDVSTAAPGQPVTFSAAAGDPDGDALSIVWSFGDVAELGASSVRVTKSWGETGDHRARVTVSDRRGGTASASVVVRVGEAGGSRIVGRVLDLGGQPVAGVRVNNGAPRARDDYREAWSDSDGSFALLGVPSGTWNLAAEAPGWLFAIDGFSRPVTTPDEAAEVAILGCWRGFSISGTVRRADGSAVAGAIVHDGMRAEPTDEAGEFSITGLASGRHVLTVETTGSVFDPRTVEVGMGDETAVYLSEKTFTIAGEVSGAGATAATVTTGWQSTTTSMGAGDAARFTLSGVPAGVWALRAVASGAGFSPSGFATPLNVTGDLSGVAFAANAAPLSAIAGRVLDRGAGLAGATVAAGGLSTVTDSRGAYWISGLSVGQYEVTVAASDAAFGATMRSVDVGSGTVSGVDFATTRVNERPVVISGPLVLGPADQPFVRLSAEATDDDGAGLLRYWWSVAGDAPGQVDFSADGALAARETTARFSAPGNYRVRVTVIDRHGFAQTAERMVAVLGDFAPPVIVEVARAEPDVVGNSLETRLAVRATSAAGEAQLITTWRVEAGAPGPVAFSPNGTAEARDAVARFRTPGNYLLRVAVRDPSGRTVESSVAVRVEVTYASWLSRHFDAAVVADPARKATIWGELADPDGDGMTNLLEYAFGLDPLVAAADGCPETKFVTDGGVEYLAISYRPNPDAIDLVFEPQVSTDLQAWQNGLVLISGPDDQMVTFRDFLPSAVHQRRFIRVNVSTVP